MVSSRRFSENCAETQIKTDELSGPVHWECLTWQRIHFSRAGGHTIQVCDSGQAAWGTLSLATAGDGREVLLYTMRTAVGRGCGGVVTDNVDGVWN